MQSRSGRLVEALRDAILSGHLRPGQPLVERELAESFGVSTTPVREALWVLTRSGLITRDPYRRTIVRQVDMGMVTSVGEIRLLLEPPAVQRAVPEHTAHTLAVARQTLDDARAAAAVGNMAGRSQLNRSFHHQLYAPGPNKQLNSILDGLWDQVALMSVVGWRGSSTWLEEADEHAAILTSVEQRDADRAIQLLRDHVAWFHDRVLAFLQRAEASSPTQHVKL